ncbi:DUF4097 family beta strand repeat-containing protein [Reichenbachiella versicolor]|uniref:DUF4097 family beta strand repeat-containing protein n=1 Tax=Reichenbachiella versicolor TaxID=1821036 RepID=UPI000D6E19ED|nr:DUF4097 family beta strand repeat-containing protein [Reichenbachiella versicolor]
MNRILLTTLLVCCYWLEGSCQLKKFYAVKDDTSYDTVRFSLKATSGTCFIKPSHHDDPLTIYGNPDFSDVNPSFSAIQSGKSQLVSLELEDYNKKGLSQAISYSMFGSEDIEENYWKVYLTNDKIYDLNLQYGVGDANVNLSNVAVSRLKLETGSADVKLTYDTDRKNRCEMDTLQVSVDMGTVVIDQMHAARAKYVTTDVGFGTVVLDLRQAPVSNCTIKAMIGAGKLKVLMPDKGVPAKVNFKTSPLCKISFEQDFKESEKGVFVNSAYTSGADNLVTFDLDVALGNIIFLYPE